MRREQTSVTAQGIAAIRAVESSRPPEERICYDPLARQLVNPLYYHLVRLLAGYGERRAPGTTGYLAARARYFDDYLQACLADGLEQLVILGAGLDSRAYRFELGGRVRVFEVDQPATQADKRRRLQRVLGELPGHVTFVPIDFKSEGLDKLFAYGYAPERKTTFTWEGVTYYLTAEAVEGTLAFVRHNSSGGSTIIFDYVEAEALTATRKRGEITRMQRYARFTGEGLTWGLPAGQVEDWLRQRGFRGVQNVTSADLKQAYFTGANRERAIAPIYAIAHACVPVQEGGEEWP